MQPHNLEDDDLIYPPAPALIWFGTIFQTSKRMNSLAASLNKGGWAACNRFGTLGQNEVGDSEVSLWRLA